jgi:hypothetical protein
MHPCPQSFAAYPFHENRTKPYAIANPALCDRERIFGPQETHYPRITGKHEVAGPETTG